MGVPRGITTEECHASDTVRSSGGHPSPGGRLTKEACSGDGGEVMGERGRGREGCKRLGGAMWDAKGRS